MHGQKNIKKNCRESPTFSHIVPKRKVMNELFHVPISSIVVRNLVKFVKRDLHIMPFGSLGV